METIKCKSWNEKEERFYYFKNGRYYKTVDCDKKNCISERVCTEFKWSNAEQSTGLHDKNGVEIYGSDIVKLVDGSISDVFFRDGSYLVHGLNHFSKGNVICYLYDYQSYEIEIIGNIHDNPELLGGAN